jgi:hypothetical protein
MAMPIKTQLTEPVERLLARERAEVLAELQRAHRRVLCDNPEGSALVARALGQALLVGLRAQCKLDGLYPHNLHARDDAWADWQRVRDETPEAVDWPHELGQTVPDAVREAGELLASAGAELDFHTRRIADLRRVGEQCAEGGAALVRTLARPAWSEPAPVEAEPGPVGPLEKDGTVRVATAANQAESELIQGMLESAGIRSTWRTVGPAATLWAQVPGAREIYVLAADASEAQAVLARTRPTP